MPHSPHETRPLPFLAAQLLTNIHTHHIHVQVADGIIAPGYEPAALEVLKKKKGGKFIVLEAKPDYEAPAGEFREVYGVGFYQDRNSVAFGKDNLKVSTRSFTLGSCCWGYHLLLSPQNAHESRRKKVTQQPHSKSLYQLSSGFF